MNKPRDILELLLLGVAFGLFLLPVLLLVGADSAAVGGIAVAYGGIVAVVAPLVARRRDARTRNGSEDEG